MIEVLRDQSIGLSRSELLSNLKKKEIPTILLYDEQGLKLFEKITHLPEYYLTSTESAILRDNATDLVAEIGAGSVVLELGSGNLQKTVIVLEALNELNRKHGTHSVYYALDMDNSELQRSIDQVEEYTVAKYGTSSFSNVSVHGLQGQYTDAGDFLSKIHSRKSILWLGSSHGNMEPSEVSELISSIVTTGRLNPTDSFIMGCDGRNAHEAVVSAYKDSQNVTAEFIMNGLVHANRILENCIFNVDDWEYVNRYMPATGYHEAFVRNKKQVLLDDVVLQPNTLFKIEQSLKYNEEQISSVLKDAGLCLSSRFDSSNGKKYSVLVARPAFASPPRQTNSPTATVADWQDLWQHWDFISQVVTRESILETKPIDLRNPCIFYLGHLPAFGDIELCKAEEMLYGETTTTDPQNYHDIFGRGIDPNVDNPEICHSHSEIPSAWPDLGAVLSYRDRCRERVLKGMQKPEMARVLWLIFEHEWMHVETFLYMLVQSCKVHAPFPAPAHLLSASHLPEMQFTSIPRGTAKLGMDDPEIVSQGPSKYGFGWDIEKPRQRVECDEFTIANRPVTNCEYREFLEETNSEQIPESWHRRKDGTLFVKSIFGRLPLKGKVSTWPVMASYEELEGYARWKNCRLPTEAELLRAMDFSSESVTTSFNACPDNARDLDGAVVNFRQWHPHSIESADLQFFAGAWEWTSTTLEPRKGYVESVLYPGYSSDFFDGEHNVVLGGSWATHGSQAERRSFRNWYQRKYKYAWTTARLVEL